MVRTPNVLTLLHGKRTVEGGVWTVAAIAQHEATGDHTNDVVVELVAVAALSPLVVVRT